MTYLELTAYLKGDKFYVPEITPRVVQRMATDEELDSFLSIISCNKRYMTLVELTNSSSSFFKAIADIAGLFPKEIYDDLYYHLKNKKRYIGVPAKLLYLLLKAKEVYVYPNLALSMIKRYDLVMFCVEGVLPEGMTILDIVQNVWQADILLLTYRRFRALYKNVYEVYVNDFVSSDGSVNHQFDQVALVNEKIIDNVDEVNWKAFCLKEDTGLINNNVVLRYLNGMYGVVNDDLDLTVVV